MSRSRLLRRQKKKIREVRVVIEVDGSDEESETVIYDDGFVDLSEHEFESAGLRILATLADEVRVYNRGVTSSLGPQQNQR